MSITSAQTLTRVNDNLKRSETDIDTELKIALKLLSGAQNVLSTSATAAIVDGDTYIAYPTDYKNLEAITLNDGTYEYKPLVQITFEKWLKNRHNESSSDRDRPKRYAVFNDKFYLDPIPGDSYTATIYYYRYHTDALTTILFGDEWRKAIYSLTTYYVAKKLGLSRHIENYGPTDEMALERALLLVSDNEHREPCATEYRDMG